MRSTLSVQATVSRFAGAFAYTPQPSSPRLLSHVRGSELEHETRDALRLAIHIRPPPPASYVRAARGANLADLRVNARE